MAAREFTVEQIANTFAVPSTLLDDFTEAGRLAHLYIADELNKSIVRLIFDESWGSNPEQELALVELGERAAWDSWDPDFEYMDEDEDDW